MQDHPQEYTFAPEDFHFEALYQGKSPMEGVELTFDIAPWDIGGPQPAVVALEETGVLCSDILDAGCGLGEHSIFLAERGYRVTGFDASPTAIAQAHERASNRGVSPRFVPADATRLEGFDQRFDTVLDSALYHCLTGRQRTEYAAALHRVTKPGARLYLFCFSDTNPSGFQFPMQVGQDDLHTHLGGHWDIHSIDLTHYTTALSPQQTKDMFGTVGIDININVLRTDEHGRVIMPVWQLHAARK